MLNLRMYFKRSVSHYGKSATIRESNHGSVYVSSISRSTTCIYVPKRFILLAGTGVWKISSVACGFSSIKIDYSD